MSKIETVEFKEFTRYLSTLPDHGKGCCICGKAAYRLGASFSTTVAGKDTNISLSIPYAALEPLDDGEKGELMINNSLPVLTRECMECGHIVFFNYKTVLENLNKESPEKAEENV
ncbi:MAG: hypothetical protein RSC68_24315 [Acinetobacter sp.]